MERPLYYLARALVAFLQALPLTWVARLGQAGGALAYFLDARHRRVTLRNLTSCFGGQKSPAEIRALARENFRRIGENYACAIKTAAMSFEELRPHVEFVANFPSLSPDGPPPSVVTAIGHFGNFELYARFGQFAPAYKCGTTYRGLRQQSLTRLMHTLRERSGCQFFERRFDKAALKAFMRQPGVMLGLLSDQHAGPRGLRLPFLGHDCSTSAAPAIFALRYQCALYTGICYRVGLARWRIEAGAEIPTRENGRPRSAAAIMLDVNRAFEAAVHRDPANWFWVHNRWKLGKVQSPQATVHSPQAAVQSPESTVQSPESTGQSPQSTGQSPESTVHSPEAGG
jgi:KDO2-lipid IV(A) lauroyltransferase